ncbi:NmrA family transcriptional regulator [Bradyrhizobium jicamae]|uniref:NmrA family transcriptional regulator n=1 Tax=Bradyrhizobium jicamae TaxID=280332 RepID=A0A0R3KIK6_9BRAD|nr:NAD(P)H-binding protein [Bradyrhizobium jicamae]KRQ95633.1 NmrA family transcriptional regulator [Bradyrhizobium jicamae]
MKIVIIGGTGLIGSKLAPLLRSRGHEVLQAAPSKGVNAVTGEGLQAALAGADVVVDVSNSPSFEDKAVLHFFETGTRNLIAAAKQAGVRHVVALSIVGTDRLEGSGYFRAKLAQERLIENAGLAYTILRATQFHDFVGAIADSGRKDGAVHVSSQLMQPLLSDEVALALADVTVGDPVGGIREVAGPEAAPMADFVGRWLRKQGDTSKVVAGADVPYFGAPLALRTLVPDNGARIMPTRFDDWLAQRSP